MALPRIVEMLVLDFNLVFFQNGGSTSSAFSAPSVQNGEASSSTTTVSQGYL